MSDWILLAAILSVF